MHMGKTVETASCFQTSGGCFLLPSQPRREHGIHFGVWYPALPCVLAFPRCVRTQEIYSQWWGGTGHGNEFKIPQGKVWLMPPGWVTTLLNCTLWKQPRSTEYKTASGQSWLKRNKTPLRACSELSGNSRTLVNGWLRSHCGLSPKWWFYGMTVIGNWCSLETWKGSVWLMGWVISTGFLQQPSQWQACAVLEQPPVPSLSVCKDFRLPAINRPQIITRLTLV